MMRTLKYTTLLAAAALLAAACSRDRTEEEMPAPAPAPAPPGGGLPICWNVEQTDAAGRDTRALIGNDYTGGEPTDPTDPDYFVPLAKACTVGADDPLKEKGFAVGLFGDYSYEEGGETVTVYDLYRGARLVYLPEVTVTDQVLSKWDTNVSTRYWQPGADYIFRAYYPQRLHNYTVSTSNASTMALVYPTRKLQYDLLIGFDTVRATPAQMRSAVDLKLGHALAALRFKFRLGFEEVDWLTSVYLINDQDEEANASKDDEDKISYFSQGTVVYGDETDPGSVVWKPDYLPPKSEQLYKWAPPQKFWQDDVDVLEERLPADTAKWSSIPGLMMSKIVKQPESTPPAPVPGTSSTNSAGSTGGAGSSGSSGGTHPGGTAYEYKYITTTAYVNGTVDENLNPVVDAAGNPVANETETGQLYSRNSGWLLIVPQKSHGTLTVCFTTKRGAKAVYKVALPKATGTKIDDKGKLLPEGAEGIDAWVAGMRYTYTITLKQTDYAVDLTIEPWNERKHSTEIIF